MRVGSSSNPPARCGPVTQYVAVKSFADDAICCVPPRSVTRRPAADIAALLIPWAWYTSGKSLISKKSDHRKTVIR
ncbi:hypothetical protein FDW94_13815 [Citrobacter sp. wls757]|nr:hypothetical protein FDW94_13815 [Citrobacter sp. wls757]